MSDFKLEIDVPAGATKIDLAPILVPLVRGLLNRHKDRNSTRVTLEAVETFIKDSFVKHQGDQQLSGLRAEWMILYLDREGWTRLEEKSDRILYRRKKVRPEPVPDWWHKQSWHNQQHHIAVPYDYAPPNTRMLWIQNAIMELWHFEGRKIPEIVKDIEDIAPVLDRMARIDP